MICPHCLKTIDDKETFCPHCHGYVGSSAHGEFIYCEGCGARLSVHDRTCPKCGRPAPGILSANSSSTDLAAGKTASFPRLTKSLIQTEAPRREPVSAARALDDSVDPSATNVLDRDDLVREERPRKRAVEAADYDPYHPKRRSYGKLIGVLVALALVAGAVSFVTLDPMGVMPGFYQWFREAARDAFPSRQLAEQGSAAPSAQTPATGSVTTVKAEDVELTDDEVFNRVSSDYELIVSFSSDEAIGEVVSAFNTYYLDPDLSDREQHSMSAYSLRDAVQDVIDDLDSIKAPEDTVYAEDIEHVRQLAEWMYGRVNQICESWDVSLAIPEGESTRAAQDEILAPMREAGSSDLENFNEHLSEWKPTRK